jgi:hypothetical protein
VLVITLVLAGILVVTLGAYLAWVQTQNKLIAESQGWNAALAAAEAGIEEGLAQVNVGFGTNYAASAQLNWGNSIAGQFGPKSTALDSGSNSTIIIDGVPGPTIISTGFVTAPMMSKTSMRVVRVTTALSSAFGNAMVALQDITFNGNNIAIDSFDSSDSNYSTGGLYDAAKRKAGGDVASTYGIVNIGNADVNGKVRTGPNATLSINQQNGFVGDLNWTGPGIQSGWWVKDFNMEVRSVSAPDTTSYVQPGSQGTTNKYVLANGNYKLDTDLSLQAGDTMLVTGDSTLYVSGNVTMQGSSGNKNAASITIAPGATLKIYVAGTSATFTQVNTTGTAKSFQYYGLPSNTSLSWGGNAGYIGTIYAPQATLSLGGGGNNHFDYQGACICNSITMNGHFNFHYDEDLKRHGPSSGFAVSSWQEL